MPGTCAGAAAGVSTSSPAINIALLMPSPPLRLFDLFITKKNVQAGDQGTTSLHIGDA